MKIALYILLLSLSIASYAQNPLMPKDTSFNIRATYSKEKKKRNYITIAAPEKHNHVLVKENIVYRKLGEHELLLDIYYPKKTKKQKPAVLFVFGGGWRSGDKSQNQAMSIELANNDYVAVSAEYRLSLEAPYPAAVYDLKATIRWMKANAKKYGIDTSKITIAGCSAGGQLAALVGTTNNDKRFEDNIGYTNVSSTVQAVIDIDGTLAFHHPESVEGAVAAQWLGGDYKNKPEVWEDAAPLNHVDNNTAPILFLNSSLPRFHAGRDDMIAKLNKLNIYSEVHTYDDTPHPFWFFNPWFKPMMTDFITFLQKQFKQ